MVRLFTCLLVSPHITSQKPPKWIIWNILYITFSQFCRGFSNFMKIIPKLNKIPIKVFFIQQSLRNKFNDVPIQVMILDSHGDCISFKMDWHYFHFTGLLYIIVCILIKIVIVRWMVLLMTAYYQHGRYRRGWSSVGGHSKGT